MIAFSLKRRPAWVAGCPGYHEDYDWGGYGDGGWWGPVAAESRVLLFTAVAPRADYPEFRLATIAPSRRGLVSCIRRPDWERVDARLPSFLDEVDHPSASPWKIQASTSPSCVTQKRFPCACCGGHLGRYVSSECRARVEEPTAKVSQGA